MICDIEFDTISFSHLAENGKYSGTFHSVSGEEYHISVVCQATTVHDYTYGRNSESCNLTITWKRKFNKFIKIKAYEIGSENALYEKKIFVNDQILTTTSTVKCQRNRNVLYVIDILPYASMTKSSNEEQSSEYQKSLNGKNKKQICEKKLEGLSTDIKTLLQAGTLFDVVLTDGNDKINAHKLILSARSTVFAKMFEHRMKENQEGVITIDDTSIVTLRALLNYMYSGMAKIEDMKMARDLYIAADNYDVQSLKAICLKLLLCVELDNVLDNLLLAALYDDKSLKEAAMKFIANNYPQMKDRPDWKIFIVEYQTLAIETLSFVLDKKN